MSEEFNGIESGVRPRINAQEVDEYFEAYPERADEFLDFARNLYTVLPEGEREEFAKHPTTFTSKQFLFRGLTMEKAKDLRSRKELLPQSGDLGAGTGVFLSDSPISAFQYQQKEVIAIFDRNELDLMGDTIIEAATAEYKQRIEELLSGLTPSERRAAVYEVDDKMDLAYKPKEGATGKNVSLRKKQPLSAVHSFLSFKNGQYVSMTVGEFLEDEQLAA